MQTFKTNFMSQGEMTIFDGVEFDLTFRDGVFLGNPGLTKFILQPVGTHVYLISTQNPDVWFRMGTGRKIGDTGLCITFNEVGDAIVELAY